MAKHLKLRISRILQSCRSKDSSALPVDPVPYFRRLPPPEFLIVGGLPAKHNNCSSLDRVDGRNGRWQDFQWQEEGNFLVVAKAYECDDSGILPQHTVALEKKKRRLRRKKKKKKPPTSSRTNLSSSSGDRWVFSSEDLGDEESEALVVSSSRSFSTDTSPGEVVSQRKLRKEKNNHRGRKTLSRQSKARKSSASVEEAAGSPARLSSVLRRLVPWQRTVVEGKVKESFAVVKRSEDPYEDFRRSIMEMIVEKEMVEERDLEQLLHCFLSLNSYRHHAVIIEAFSEICQALFRGRRSNVSS